MQRHFKHISVEDARSLMAEEAVQLVDIRDPDSHAQNHIQGSIRVDNQNLKEFLDQADRKVPLIVYCYHGNASQSAAEFMGQQGFEQAYSLDGGFKRWHDLSQMDHSG
ncbi:MAG: thiosulfate sulfurtransferase GlpE [Gammaproteobacteria bacterium]|nr:thiosulfate sulfurtransferase GlpE [Gammaproteobacteria bacterium]